MLLRLLLMVELEHAVVVTTITAVVLRFDHTGYADRMSGVESGRPARPVVVWMVNDHRNGALGRWFVIFDDDAATGATTSDHDGTTYATTVAATIALDRRTVCVLIVELMVVV